MKVGSTVGQQSTKAVNAVSKTLGKATSGRPPLFTWIEFRGEQAGQESQGADLEAQKGGSTGGAERLQFEQPQGQRNTVSALGNAGGSPGFNQQRKTNNPGRGPQGPSRPNSGGPKPSFQKIRKIPMMQAA